MAALVWFQREGEAVKMEERLRVEEEKKRGGWLCLG
jgi:hypothetical protein